MMVTILTWGLKYQISPPPLQGFTWGPEWLFNELADHIKDEHTITGLGVPGQLVDPLQQMGVLLVREQGEQTAHHLRSREERSGYNVHLLYSQNKQVTLDLLSVTEP